MIHHRSATIQKLRKDPTMSKKVAFTSLCLLFYTIPLASAFAQEQNCEKLQSTAEQSECLDQKLRRAETEMNRAFQHALSEYLRSTERDNEAPKLSKLDLQLIHETEKRTLRSLRQSQARWLAYRESACSAVENSYGGGTAAAVAVPACKLDFTQQRTVWLRSYFDHDYDESNAKPSGQEPCSR